MQQQAKYFPQISNTGVFKFRDEIINDLEKPQPNNTSEISKSQQDERKQAKTVISDQVQTINLKNTAQTSPRVQNTFPRSPIKESVGNPSEIKIENLDYFNDKQQGDSPRLRDNFFMASSYSPSMNRHKFIRGTSMVQSESGKFVLSNKNSKLTVSDMIDKNQEYQQANRSPVNKEFEGWFGNDNKPTKHRPRKPARNIQSAQKSHRTLPRTSSASQILRPYEREDLQKLYRDLKSRQGSSAKRSRPQTSANSHEFFTTKLDFSPSHGFEVIGMSMQTKTMAPNFDSLSLSMTPDLIATDRSNDIKDTDNGAYGAYSGQRPVSSGHMTYRSMRVKTEYDEISRDAIAELELAAPWSKKKGSLQLSLNCIKPYYFVETKPATVREHALSSTSRKEKEDTSSEFLNAMGNKSSSRQLVQSPKTPRPVLSSRHNQFRPQPEKTYITEMHYLGDGVLSEYGLKGNVSTR